MRADGCADIENAFVNTCPVEDVFRPAVSTAGDNSKHVFHARGDAGPVMRLHLWHRHDEVGNQNGPRKPEMTEAGVVRMQLDLCEFIAIEIHEPDPSMEEVIPKTRFKEKQLRVAMMTGAFSNRDGSCSQPQKGFSGGADELSVCIHRFACDVLHNVGFEQNGLPTDIQLERPDSVVNKLVELFG